MSASWPDHSKVHFEPLPHSNFTWESNTTQQTSNVPGMFMTTNTPYVPPVAAAGKRGILSSKAFRRTDPNPCWLGSHLPLLQKNKHTLTFKEVRIKDEISSRRWSWKTDAPCSHTLNTYFLSGTSTRSCCFMNSMSNSNEHNVQFRMHANPPNIEQK